MEFFGGRQRTKSWGSCLCYRAYHKMIAAKKFVRFGGKAHIWGTAVTQAPVVCNLNITIEHNQIHLSDSAISCAICSILSCEPCV